MLGGVKRGLICLDLTPKSRLPTQPSPRARALQSRACGQLVVIFSPGVLP